VWSSRRAPTQEVSRQEAQARELQLAVGPPQARVSRQVREHAVLVEPQPVLELLASQPPVGAQAQPEEQRELAQVPKDGVKLLWPPLPSQHAPLPPQFPRPPHLSDVA
jgi:hypothetical protein